MSNLFKLASMTCYIKPFPPPFPIITPKTQVKKFGEKARVLVEKEEESKKKSKAWLEESSWIPKTC